MSAVRTQEGDLCLTAPRTAGAVAGGFMVIAAPWPAVMAAIADLVAKIKIEIVRIKPPDDDEPDTGLPELSGD